MATKNKNLHYAKRDAIADAQDYFDAYGTLQGWQDPYADIGSGDQWLNTAKGMGYAGNDGEYQPEEMQKLLTDSASYWGQEPKEAKYGKGTDLLKKSLPYLALAAQAIPGVGQALSGALGPKIAGLLTGAGKFSNNAGINLLTKAAISKAAPELGKGFMIAQLGQSLNSPGAKAMQQIPGMMGYTSPPPTAPPSNRYSLGSLGSSAPPKNQYSLQDVGKEQGAFGQYGLLEPMDLENSNPFDATLEQYLPKVEQLGLGMNPGLQGATPGPGSGGSYAQPNLQTHYQPQQNSALQLAALSMIGKKLFEKNESAPAPKPTTATAQQPTYPSLLGMITNRDAAEDQRRRLQFKGGF